jgi:predicted ribosome quality control (RQC) complex YloA/Tae2 family protein
MNAPTNAPTPPPADSPLAKRATALLRALRKHRQRTERKAEAIRGDLAEADRGLEHRRAGEALLTYIHQVPKRAARVTLPDPADPSRTLEIELDPALNAQANAARLFKRAAKAERALEEVPVRLKAAEVEAARAEGFAKRVEAELAEPGEWDGPRERRFARLLDEAFKLLPPVLQREVPAARAAAPRGDAGTPAASAAAPLHVPAKRREPVLPARLTPRRLKTAEGWDVMIGRNNEGNDHLTHHMARPEDYWFHVHGCPGSHVVLRRGKGKNEPSKRTMEEVAAWAAFYSQARTAGKVPVIWTLKKYVRRPRKAPAGLAVCEREKTLMVRPVEPPRESLADHLPADAGETSD